MRSSFLGLYVLAALGCGCGCGCASKRPVSIESEVAVAPSAPQWQRATVSMIFEPGHGNYTTRIRYWLKLSGPAGESASTLEEVFPPFGVPSPRAVSEAELETLKRTKPRVLLAADGHALLFSRDGARYRYVAFDAGAKPVFCRHVDVEGGWASAPTSRALALAILRTKQDHDEPHYPSSHGAWSSAFEHEALGAVTYACAHRDDPELRAAVVTASAQWKPFATTVVLDAASACVALLR